MAKIAKLSFVLQIITYTLVIFFTPDLALASVDDKGMAIYSKLARIAYWIILFRGLVSIVQNVLDGDYREAKVKFFAYLLCYALVLGYPMALTELEGLFK